MSLENSQRIARIHSSVHFLTAQTLPWMMIPPPFLQPWATFLFLGGWVKEKMFETQWVLGEHIQNVHILFAMILLHLAGDP